jgi:hypothetical protein
VARPPAAASPATSTAGGGAGRGRAGAGHRNIRREGRGAGSEESGGARGGNGHPERPESKRRRGREVRRQCPSMLLALIVACALEVCVSFVHARLSARGVDCRSVPNAPRRPSPASRSPYAFLSVCVRADRAVRWQDRDTRAARPQRPAAGQRELDTISSPGLRATRSRTQADASPAPHRPAHESQARRILLALLGLGSDSINVEVTLNFQCVQHSCKQASVHTTLWTCAPAAVPQCVRFGEPTVRV